MAASKIDSIIIGSSPIISELKRLIVQVASSNVSVVLTGPSGVGKEVAARAIHKMSDRANQPFVAINCGAIPKDLFESELFGHEKGSFTGAVQQRKGRFETADKGTLFLDEIGDMPLDLQVKLLRVLEEATIQRVGGNREIAVDVRIVSATNQDMAEAITQKKFREDLYYRLNVVRINIPPLSERREDVTDIAMHLSQNIGSAEGKLEFTDSALRALQSYDWPGNVRELRNFVERTHVFSSGQPIDEATAQRLIDMGRRTPKIADEQDELWDATDDFAKAFDSENARTEFAPDDHRPPQIDASHKVTASTKMHEPADILLQGASFDLKEHLATIERSFLKEALHASNGSVTAAAKLLNIKRTTLIDKMQKYDMKT